MKTLKSLKAQHAPFTVQIEPTEGCNLGCNFCGLRGIREKGTAPLKFMTLETAEIIASEMSKAGWKSKVVFAMHGEPTLNPKLFEIVKVFRKYLPKNLFYIITNSKGIVKSGDPLQYVTRLKDSGINHVLLDNYSADGDWSKVVKAVEGTYKVLTLGKGVPFYSTKKSFELMMIPPIDEKLVSSTRNLVNHCGAAFPPSDKYKIKRCAMPFRELSFRYDGNVSICCDDFRGEYPIESIHNMDIVSLWNHPRFQAARVLIYNRERSFHPCNVCTNISMRVGFLPDPQGQETLPEPTDELRKFAHKVSKENKSLTKIYKREWEK